MLKSGFSLGFFLETLRKIQEYRYCEFHFSGAIKNELDCDLEIDL